MYVGIPHDSAILFVLSWFIFPRWEKERLAMGQGSLRLSLLLADRVTSISVFVFAPRNKWFPVKNFEGEKESLFIF